MRIPSQLILIISLSITLMSIPFSAYSFEEYYTTPGTRAQGMAGNFVALATDSSAIWYNPAGLGFNSIASGLSGDLTLEVGDYVIYDDNVGIEDDDVFSTQGQVKYAGGTFGPIGYAYFRPYEFYSSARNTSDNTIYQIHTNYTELKFAFGFEIIEGIAIGSSLDLIFQEYDSNCDDCFESTGEISSGYSLGVLGKYRFENGISVRAGITARSDVKIDNEFADFEGLPSRPYTTAYGLALGFPVSSTYLIVTTQHETITYNEQQSPFFTGESINEPFNPGYTRTGYGAEWAMYPSDSITFFIRAGTSNTESDQAPTYAIFDEIKVSTFGLGLSFANGIVLDVASESREINYTPTDLSKKVDLTSASISWAF